jgi:hypothetical protein
MALTLYGYVGIHIATGVGIFIITGIILALISIYSHHVYHFLTNRLLGIELVYPTGKIDTVYPNIKIDDKQVKSNRPAFDNRFLWFLSTSTCTVALMVLYEGCILGNAGVYLGDYCPSDPMTCFASSDDTNSGEVGTFQCVPGNLTAFPGETNKAWCYGWIVTRQTVSSVINQIGICGGILGVSGTLFAFAFRSGPDRRYQFCTLIVLLSLPIIAIILMIAITVPLHISFSVLAYLVVIEIFILFLTAFIFKVEDYKDRNAVSPTS